MTKTSSARTAPAPPDPGMALLIRNLLGVLDGRSHQALASRLHGSTYESIGAELGLSKHRAFQLATKAEELVIARLRAPSFTSLRSRLAELRATLGVAAPVDTPATRAVIDHAIGQTLDQHELFAAALFLAGPYRIRDGWYTLAGADTLPAPDALDHLADAFGIVALDVAHTHLARSGISSPFRTAWIEHCGRWRRHKTSLMRWTGPVADKCVALLATHNTPMTIRTMNDLIGTGHRITSTRNALHLDPRVIRVGPHRWGLRDRDGSPYTTIVDAITGHIARHPGPCHAPTLTDTLVRDHGVSASSVRAYLRSPLFLIENDFVRLRTPDDPGRAPPALSTRGMFRAPDGTISLTATVSSEMLRGSGDSFPPAAAAALGVVLGGERIFTSPQGAVRVSWSPRTPGYAQIGTLRRTAQTVGAREGDHVRIDFSPDGTIDAERIPAGRSGIGAAETLRLFTGISAPADALPAAVAAAIGEQPPNVALALTRRGDSHIAALLGAATGHPAVADPSSLVPRQPWVRSTHDWRIQWRSLPTLYPVLYRPDGTTDTDIDHYCTSPAFLALAPATRRIYAPYLRRWLSFLTARGTDWRDADAEAATAYHRAIRQPRRSVGMPTKQFHVSRAALRHFHRHQPIAASTVAATTFASL